MKLGILDSGIGGLTFVKQITEAKLDLEIIYISDEKNVPYGNKDQSFMLDRMILISQKLIDAGADAIFIACNTATAETIDELRSLFAIHFIGIEPYINYLNHNNESNENIGLILTTNTFNSNRFKKLKQKVDPKDLIKTIPLPKLALHIEKLKNQRIEDLKDDIAAELDSIKAYNFDTLILGCTHYPIIKDFIESYLNVKTVDPALNILEHIKKLFNLNDKSTKQGNFLYSSIPEEQIRSVAINEFKFLESNQK